MGHELWERVRSVDRAHPDDVEAPRHGRRTATARAVDLAEQLAAAFDSAAVVLEQQQDSAHLGDITVPAEATAAGEALRIRVSNFGALVVWSPGGLLAFDDDEKQARVAERDRQRVVAAFEATGHVAVDDIALAEVEYDGVSTRFLEAYAHPNSAPPTWWHRFFDWV